MPELHKTSEQLAKDMQQRYRNVFGTEEGSIVLGDILTLGHFGEILNPSEDARLGEYNLAITIARLAGAFDQLYREHGMTGE
jgi:hypothetical protein